MRTLAAAVLFLTVGLAQAASNFNFAPQPGPHAVGLRVVEQYDYARAYRGSYDTVTGQPVTGEKARPVQTVIWYPAQRGGQPVSYGDYVNQGASVDKFGLSQGEIARHGSDALKNSPIGQAQVKQELARPMWAVRDAKPAAGKFPVVIYAPSFGAMPYENADLCEYLASNGYLVISSPSVGAHAREMSDDLEGIETQAADIAFLINYAHGLPNADTTKLAVAGFSWGGISNVFVAARDSRVKALVNLDGSVRYWTELVEQARYVTPARVTAPMLFVAQRPRSLEALARRDKPVTSFLNQMKYADLYLVTMNPMEHFAFASEALRFQSPQAFTEYSQAEMAEAHGWTARYVLQFLNAYLLDQAPAQTFLGNTPVQNGMPAHMATVERRAAQGAAPTLEMLAHDAAKTGFTNVQAVFDGMRRLDPKFAIPEQVLNGWGYKILATGNKPGAIAIFTLTTTQYPQSGNAFDSLAEAYEASDDKTQAIANYQRSLQLDPTNDNAARHLKALGAAP